MCGISVLLDRAASAAGAATLRAMHELIPHRGPDGEGFLLVDRAGRWRRDARAGDGSFEALLGVASRRLKILDLTDAAAQPMSTPDGTMWIVFNGEIYNFRELRAELVTLGHRFRTSGDTEVALAAFATWGDRCFERFAGMWALAILDLPRRRLVASRDRFGIKPLYWTVDGERLLLASEIRQLLRARRSRPEAQAPLVRRFLQADRLPCLEETFFTGIRAVPPGTWLEVPFDADAPPEPRFRRYWDLADVSCPDPGAPGRSYADAVEEFRALLARVVASHDVADVTVGSLLSGGLDSSTVAGLLAARARAADKPCPTFSFGFRDAAPEFCELEYVDALVKRGGLLNHETTFDAAWVAAHAPAVVRALEEPPLAMAALAQYRVFQLAREHGATVVLDGQGADEVLGGYPYYQRDLLFDRLTHGRFGEFSAELRAIGRRQARPPLTILADFFVRPLAARLRRRPYAWLAPGYGTGAPSDEALEAARDHGRDPARVNRRLYWDVKWGNVKIVVGYSDKNAMAHSIEARVPYLDHRLVEFAFSLPDRYKVGGGERKRILRDVARDVIPAEITERPDRMGFGVPERTILRGGLWPTVRDVVTDRRLLGAACLDAAAATRFIEDFAAVRHDDVRALWRLYALGLWAAAFDVRL